MPKHRFDEVVQGELGLHVGTDVSTFRISQHDTAKKASRAGSYGFGFGALGFTVDADTEGRAIIGAVSERGQATSVGVPLHGVVQAVNGHSVRGFSKDDVVRLIEGAPRPLLLKIQAPKRRSSSSSAAAEAATPNSVAASALSGSPPPSEPADTPRASLLFDDDEEEDPLELGADISAEGGGGGSSSGAHVSEAVERGGRRGRIAALPRHRRRCPQSMRGCSRRGCRAVASGRR